MQKENRKEQIEETKKEKEEFNEKFVDEEERSIRRGQARGRPAHLRGRSKGEDWSEERKWQEEKRERDIELRQNTENEKTGGLRGDGC